MSTTTKQLHIAALGSSFAAGPGIPPRIDRGAMRSGQNYAHLLSERLGARLTDLTVSGATLKNLLNEPQVFFFRTFPPQVSQIPEDVDIVTITAGGNDLNYIGSMMRDVIGTTLPGRLLSSMLPSGENSSSMTAEDVAERLTAVIDAVFHKSPKCRVFLVEYLTVLGPNTASLRAVDLDEDQIRHHQSIAEKLGAAYRLAAKSRPGVELIPMAELSKDHGVGTENPWVDGLSISSVIARKAPFHPNLEGMRNVAKVLYSRLK